MGDAWKHQENVLANAVEVVAPNPIVIELLAAIPVSTVAGLPTVNDIDRITQLEADVAALKAKVGLP